jgi:hypothetical protein
VEWLIAIGAGLFVALVLPGLARALSAVLLLALGLHLLGVAGVTAVGLLAAIMWRWGR